MEMALRSQAQAACSSPSFRLRRELLARKEFAGWAPTDKLRGKRIANSLGKGGMISARTLPQGLRLHAARGAQVPVPVGWGTWAQTAG